MKLIHVVQHLPKYMYKGIYLHHSLQKNIFILNVKNGGSTSFIIQSHSSLEFMLSRPLFSCIRVLISTFSIYQWLIRRYFIIKEATHFHSFVALTPETDFVQRLFMCGLSCHRSVGLLHIIYTNFILIQKNTLFYLLKYPIFFAIH
jgi:hypothetical protein